MTTRARPPHYNVAPRSQCWPMADPVYRGHCASINTIVNKIRDRVCKYFNSYSSAAFTQEASIRVSFKISRCGVIHYLECVFNIAVSEKLYFVDT